MSEPSTEIRAFIALAERFAEKELAPRAIAGDNYPFAPFNLEALAAAAGAGLLGITLPEKLGGVGQGLTALCEVLFVLAQEDASFAAVLMADAFARDLLAQAGRDDLLKKYAGGRLGVLLYDSPRELPRGLAVEDAPEGPVLSGKAEYAALAPVASALILPGYSRRDDKMGLYLIDAHAAGVEIGPPVPSLGLRGCPAADVTITAGRAEAVFAEAIPAYLAVAEQYLAAAAALSAGVCAGSFRAARAYAAERYQGGRMIIDYDMVRQMLANLAVAAETGKALFREMARLADRGEPAPLLIAGAVLAADQAAAAASDGVQCLGGYGYMEDYGQEKRLRDAKQIAAIFGPGPIKKMELIEGLITGRITT